MLGIDGGVGATSAWKSYWTLSAGPALCLAFAFDDAVRSVVLALLWYPHSTDLQLSCSHFIYLFFISIIPYKTHTYINILTTDVEIHYSVGPISAGCSATSSIYSYHACMPPLFLLEKKKKNDRKCEQFRTRGHPPNSVIRGVCY